MKYLAYYGMYCVIIGGLFLTFLGIYWRLKR